MILFWPRGPNIMTLRVKFGLRATIWHLLVVFLYFLLIENCPTTNFQHPTTFFLSSLFVSRLQRISWFFCWNKRTNSLLQFNSAGWAQLRLSIPPTWLMCCALQTRKEINGRSHGGKREIRVLILILFLHPGVQSPYSPRFRRHGN